MKKLFSLLFFCLLLQPAFAQSPFLEIGALASDNYFDICRKAEDYFRDDYVRENPEAPYNDDEYCAFQRWKWYWKTRVDENGRFPDLAAAHRQADSLKSLQATRSAQAAWTNISQGSCSGGYNGMGRVACIAFDPSNVNTFYVGAPIGGLWKTTDGGQSWTPLTDALPYVSVGSCVIDPVNPGTMYISVGDHIGWWNFSMGVYKTTDGGATWNATGLSWTLSQNRMVSMLAMDPNNNAVLYAATSNGLYKTTDGGANWTVVRAGFYSDIRFQPNSSNIYAALHDYWGSSEVFRSTDGGANWTQLSNFGLLYNWIRMSVTPANAAKIAILNTADNSLYTSSNYGGTLNFMSTVPENAMLLYSPNNANLLYCGSLFVHQSTDGGANWTQKTYWYNNPPYDEVHADQHNGAFHPLNPDRLYFCNDGGLYRYSEGGDNWTELSDGLKITQFYKIANSQLNAQVILGGTQDNGGRIRDASGTWRGTNGGDAMEVAIDPTDDDVIYTTYINGKMYRSLDAWVNDVYNEISANIPGGTPPGSWVAPYMLDPSDNQTIVAGYDDVWRSTDRGDNWTALSSNITGTGATLNCLAVAASDPNTIYASEGTTIYKTTNLGGSWSTLTAPGSSSAEITSITIHPNNANVLWITRGGYSGGIKVYHSVNGGSSWTSISSGLPNVPVNTLTYVNGSNGALFIGTETGIYYRDSVTNAWQAYGTALPNTSVTDIEIQYAAGKVRAATYGRGIWETNLTGIPMAVPAVAQARGLLQVYPNPGNGLFNLRYQSPQRGDVLIEVLDMTGRKVYSKNLQMNGLLEQELDLTACAAGTYCLRIVQEQELMQRLITRQ